MYSDRYYYFNIYFDKTLSKCVDTKEVVDFLHDIEELNYEGKGSYRNIKGFPFLDMQLLSVRSIDSYSSHDFSRKETNFISVVCTKGCQNEFLELKRIFEQIISFLGWITEEDEE